MRRERDEWDDYWDDIARSVGAKMIMEPKIMYGVGKDRKMEKADPEIRKQRIKHYNHALECKQYIEDGIRAGYDYSRSHLDTSSAAEAVKKYGARTVEIVLGLTIYDKGKWDSRFSRSNVEWAAGIHGGLTEEENLTFMVRDKFYPWLQIATPDCWICTQQTPEKQSRMSWKEKLRCRKIKEQAAFMISTRITFLFLARAWSRTEEA